MIKFTAAKSLAFATAAVLATLSLGQSAPACTGIRLTAKDGTGRRRAHARIRHRLKSQVAVYPRGTSFTGDLPGGAKGIAFKSRFGVVGANGLGLPAIVDGLNDQGLYAGMFFFPGYATFTPVTTENASHSMANYQYALWILANFATVAEVKAAFNTVSLAATPVAQLAVPRPSTSASSTRRARRS